MLICKLNIFNKCLEVRGFISIREGYKYCKCQEKRRKIYNQLLTLS